jgi:ferredoxin
MRTARLLPRDALQSLLDALKTAGHRVIGPVAEQGAIQFHELDSAAQLPHGVRETQSPGRYRLSYEATNRTFAWASGPQALKPLLFPSRETLWQSQRDASGRLRFEPIQPDAAPLAVIGVRACDLAALDLHDRHFLGQASDRAVPDPAYAARRERLLLIAVNCSHPADTCFCVSTGDGPRVDTGADIVLDELDEGFVVTPTSNAGQGIVDGMGLAGAESEHLAAAATQSADAAAAQTRQLPARDLQAQLFDRLDHPRWDQVATRCLACGNCTSVCPTCFCHTESDVPALDGMRSQHVREWDSCFSEGHAYLHGYQVRPEISHRFRQWMTHKLGSWHTQFGRSGCVGCGRCITWCPVGIDITEEATAICGRQPRGGEA